MWSFVGNKKNKRWLWYAYEPVSKKIIAHVFGDRSRYTLNRLLELLEPFNISLISTDLFAVYQAVIPEQKHIVGKIFTQGIERNNLSLRNRIKRLQRKTIAFSKSIAMHDKIIGSFIQRLFYL